MKPPPQQKIAPEKPTPSEKDQTLLVPMLNFTPGEENEKFLCTDLAL